MCAWVITPFEEDELHEPLKVGNSANDQQLAGFKWFLYLGQLVLRILFWDRTANLRESRH